MDCSQIPWSAMLMGPHEDTLSIDSRAIGLHGFETFSIVLSKKKTQKDKLRVLLTFCKKRFPNLKSELSGKFKDDEGLGKFKDDEGLGKFKDDEGLVTGMDVEDDSGAGPSEVLHPVKVRRKNRAATGMALLSLAKLCLKHLIYPPIFFAELLRGMLEAGETPKYGSGLYLDSPRAMVCANAADIYSNCCQKPAALPCPHCHLVSYCSDKCCKAHWNFGHKVACPSVREPGSQRLEQIRQTYAVIRKSGQTAHPSPAILWEVLPAFGLLRNAQAHKSIPARELPKPLRLLFTNCFDLNNVVETLHQLDPQFRGEATLHIDTASMHCLARHIILWTLLLDIAEKRIEESAVDAVIAIWYSATLTASQYLLLMDTVLRLLNSTTILPSHSGLDRNHPVFLPNSDLSSIQEDMNDMSMLYSKYELDGILRQIPGSGSCIYLHTRGVELWKYLTLMGISSWHPNQATREIAMSKFDQVDAREDFLLDPHVYALDAFRYTGLALPFSSLSFGNHSIPNPTLVSPINNPRAGWAVRCTRYDPLCGWPINEVSLLVSSELIENFLVVRRMLVQTCDYCPEFMMPYLTLYRGGLSKVLKSTRGAPCNVPKNDLFGAQYFFVRTRILSAVDKLRNCRVDVEFSRHVDACRQVASVMRRGPGLQSFHRIHSDFHTRAGHTTNLSLKEFFRAFTGLLVPKRSALIMLHQLRFAEDGRILSEDIDDDQLDIAWSNFDKFISKFKDKFAVQLRSYSEAIRKDPRKFNNLIPLFMGHGPYLGGLRSAMRDYCISEGRAFEPYALTAMSNQTAVPITPYLLFRHPLDQDARTSKRGKKVRRTSLATAEECYMQVFFTGLLHLELFLEFQPSTNVADWYRSETENAMPTELDSTRLRHRRI